MDEPDQVPVHVALNRVQSDIGAIGKDRENKDQGFSFRGIEDVMNELHPILVRHGVVIVPTASNVEVHHHERTTQAGKKSVTTQVIQRMMFYIYGPMGDFIVAATFGEGSDFADKATNKSTSSALKYLLTTMLSIPTYDIEDSDRSGVAIEHGEYDEHEARRNGLRDVVAGLPDEQQAEMVAWLREHQISLRYVCTGEQLTDVELRLAALA